MSVPDLKCKHRPWIQGKLIGKLSAEGIRVKEEEQKNERKEYLYVHIQILNGNG